MKTILPGQVRVGCALNIPLQNFFCLCGLSEGAPKLWLKCQESLVSCMVQKRFRDWFDGRKKTSYIKGTIAACNPPARFWQEKKRLRFNS